MQASEVPTAVWVSTSGATPRAGRTNISAGTMIMPPPIPSRPASRPATAPVTMKIDTETSIAAS
jgi:hypothetical protein